jgi:pimeloyl-ACP methyl ester carboxylesterase
MKPKTLDEEYPQNMIFLKESEKENVLMTDGHEIPCYYSKKQGNFEKITFLFIQGVGPGVYSWTDFWDELFQMYDLVVIDSREKPTVDLKKKGECSVNRMSLDIVEIMHHLKINEENVAFFGSSIGVHYIAHCIGQGWINPKVCFLAGPQVKPNYPKISSKIAFSLPAFLLEKVGKQIARRYLRNKIESVFQKKVYNDRINKIDVRRWKQCSKIRYWDSSDNLKKIECPVYIFCATEDRYHNVQSAKQVGELVQDSRFIDIPDYNFIHTKPGVVEFVKMIENIIDDLE